MSWTDERVEKLKSMWRAGKSASEIAADLGNVTRNAVIGKVHRLGLASRKGGDAAEDGAANGQTSKSPPQPVAKAEAPAKGNAPAPAATSSPNPSLNGAKEPEEDAVVAAEPVEPTTSVDESVIPMRRISIFKLTERTCKWPIGDPSHADFHFCGADAKEGAPYCEHHCSLAYQAQDRNRMRRAG